MRPFSSYFWGLLFIVVGLAFIIKYAFHVENLPIFRVVVGFILIYCGISVIVGGFSITSKNNIVFNNDNIHIESKEDEYNILFSKGSVDLSDIQLQGKNRNIKVHTVFAKGTVIVNPNVPAVIKVSSVFASASIPNNTTISFGDYTYRTRAYKDGEPYLKLEADVVFGQVDIIEQQ